LLVACGGNDDDSRERQIEQAAKEHGLDADVTMGADGEVSNVVINNANGAQIGKDLKLPSGFPEDVVLPDTWTIMASSPTPGGFMLNGTTETTVDEAVAEARQLLTDEGWAEIGFAQPNAMMTQVGFEKDDRMTNLNFMDTGATKNVQLVTMKKPN
jgi:hypothetical protein